MIALKANGKKAIDIDEESIRKILNIYPDEHLANRPIFANAFSSGEIAFTDLRKECNTLMIPWQLFLLDSSKIDDTVAKINDRRKAKFDNRMIASRDNGEGGISLRIADRLIALQEFASKTINDQNPYCGSLVGQHRDKWAKLVTDHFQIDRKRLTGGKKGKTLDYIISCAEAQDVRIARGVLDSNNLLLPVARDILPIYRKSSGFAVKDDKVPYIFLPNELNDSETAGRQVLTLFVLLILIGNDQYNLYLSGELELQLKGQRTLRQAFGVATDILLPHEETDKLSGKKITNAMRDDLASRFMLSPSAIVVTLRQRGIITSDVEQQKLLDGITGVPLGESTSTFKRAANIDTAIKKMYGNTTTNDIINAITSRSLKSTEAQYLIFGRIDKLRFAKFKATVGI